jgi:hypothetical protein
MLVTLMLDVRNTSGGPIDHVVFKSAEDVPTRVRAARVDGDPARVSFRPGRISVSLGGDLAAGGHAALRLDLALGLGRRITDLGYFHAERDRVIQVAEWLPRVNPGFTDRIELTIRAPDGWVVAHGSVDNARELPIAASPRYRRLRTTVGRYRITLLYLPGGLETARTTLRQARRALPWLEHRLGPTPRTRITIAQVHAVDLAYSWPGIIWLPANLPPSRVEVFIAHELAHQWFGGVVPTRNRHKEPFTGEAPSDLLARLFRHGLRPSSCPGWRLDLRKGAYGSCFYEAVYVDGANVLNRVRNRMGSDSFWRAIRTYLRENRFTPVGIRELLTALRRGTNVNLRPILHPRFPSIVP